MLMCFKETILFNCADYIVTHINCALFKIILPQEREEIAQEIEVQQKREAEKEAKRLEKEKQKQEELRRAAFSNVVYIPTTK